jgi:UDP-N-acetyl-2-amino-2-deoxyglucuronate dehydrogenase
MYNFAITGVAGYIAPKHLDAIYITQNTLLAALDPHDSVGILDKYFPDCRFFTEPERFDRYLEKLRRYQVGIDYVTICSPNYLHDAHCRLALRVGANAICEKPLVINPWNLNQLKELEEEYGKKIYVVLQLRLDPKLQELKKTVTSDHKVKINYLTPRGMWYLSSWKGDEKKSGGLITNIGIHFLDMVLWLFGQCESYIIEEYTDKKIKGKVWLEKALVEFFLSTDKTDIVKGQPFRSIIIDDQEFVFGDNFTGLHTEVYKDILNGGGFGIEDARQSIELSYLLRGVEKCKFMNLLT